MSITVHHGDMLEVLPTLSARFHAVVTDPPYHLASIVKRFGADGAASAKVGQTGAYARASKGFMGKQWDGGDIAFRPETWAAVGSVMLPGAHLVAFAGTKGFHRMACAIEDAGFEIRDTLMYLYGTGFPKSHNVEKSAREAICRCSSGIDPVRSVREGSHDASGLGQEGEETDLLKAMQRPVARSGVGGARPQGIGGSKDKGRGSRPEECGLEGRRDIQEAARELCDREVCPMPGPVSEHGENGRLRHGASACDGSLGRSSADTRRDSASSGPQAAEQRPREPGVVAGQPEPQAGGAWPVCGRCGKPIVPRGLGTALKPAYEPIVLARWPMDRKTVAANVLAHGTGALNIDACRIEASGRPLIIGNDGSGFGGVGVSLGSKAAGSTDLGRWPANVVHDGSEEVIAAFPASNARPAKAILAGGTSGSGKKDQSAVYGAGREYLARTGYDDAETSAARFFYSAKADAGDRLQSKHPTVKPVDLMRWLVRMVTPKGGHVLDPFAGSGTTGMACMAEGFDCHLIEREAEYVADIRRRIAHVSGADAPLFAKVAAE